MDYAEAQVIRFFRFITEEELGHDHAEGVDQQTQQQRHAEVVKALRLKAALKGHHHHAGRDHIHDQMAAVPAELFADHLGFAQGKTDAGQYK